MTTMSAMQIAVNKKREAETEIAHIMRLSAEAMKTGGLIVTACSDPKRLEIVNRVGMLVADSSEGKDQ